MKEEAGKENCQKDLRKMKIIDSKYIIHVDINWIWIVKKLIIPLIALIPFLSYVVFNWDILSLFDYMGIISCYFLTMVLIIGIFWVEYVFNPVERGEHGKDYDIRTKKIKVGLLCFYCHELGHSWCNGCSILDVVKRERRNDVLNNKGLLTK